MSSALSEECAETEVITSLSQADIQEGDKWIGSSSW